MMIVVWAYLFAVIDFVLAGLQVGLGLSRLAIAVVVRRTNMRLSMMVGRRLSMTVCLGLDCGRVQSADYSGR